MTPTLTEALAERGYDTLTEVQEAVTDPGLQDSDLLVSAQTGSGKTVGFGLAIAGNLMGGGAHLGPAAEPMALVVAPTRELALQVMRELGWLYAKAGARVVSCVGGMDMRDERRALDRGAHIVVGTPGRLRDHIHRGSLDLEGLRVVVLDEADEMLDLGFREDLEFMLDAAPQTRRTLMFSATVPPTIAKLAEQFQRDAVRVTTLSGKSQHSDIDYQAVQVGPNDAEHAIFNLLRFHDAENALVFANTRAAVSHLTARLTNRGFSVVSLSGELSQSERTHALQAMRDGRARVCVATDVAARGIDLPGLELVIHADLPSNAEGLLHRSGRTGRAGRKGISALIIPPRTTKKAERLLKFAKIRANWTNAPSASDILRRDEERLLADPVWSEDATPEQAAFAAKLLELHGPDKIAAAYLRLYQTRLSAPEELGAPEAARKPSERKPFGPSTWFSLSVGQDQRAEARWLLPLLCRAANMDKSAIGAIRVQQSETFVEIAEGSAENLRGIVADGGALEEGITVNALDGAPDLTAVARRPSSPRPVARPPREKPGNDRENKAGAPVPRAKPDRQENPVEATPKPVRSAPVAGEKKPRSSNPREDRKGGKPGSKPGASKRADRAAAYAPADKRSKPRMGKSSAAPAKPRISNASDPSKPMSRPGKPDRVRGGKRGPGSAPPKRTKR